MGIGGGVLTGLRRVRDGWGLEQDLLHRGAESAAALFTSSNGYLGVRGAEREPFGDSGLVLLAGCHETRPYAHPERTFGVPEHYQTLVAVTDPFVVSLSVDGAMISDSVGTWLEHRRRLDLRTGLVTVDGRFCCADIELELHMRRLVSVSDPGCCWHEVRLETTGRSCGVAIEVAMAANTSSSTFPDEPVALSRAWGPVFRSREQAHDGTRAGLAHETALSGRIVAAASDVRASCPPADVVVSADRVRRRFRATVGPAVPFVLTQCTSFVEGGRGDGRDLLAAAMQATDCHSRSFEDVLVRQREAYDEFWSVADVTLEGAPDVELAVRFGSFHLFQSAVQRGGRPGSAKGLTGRGYEGHQLWEQEMYVGHALDFLLPRLTRSALDFRIRTLPAARDRAAQLGHRGALYPWRTIDGTEASAFFPAGAAQHHINAAVVWAIDHHVDVTGDETVLLQGGLEVFVETARLWMSVGRFDVEGRFRIDGVTGPDEYTALIDNNLYTNLMAAHNLLRAAAGADRCQDADPERLGDLMARLRVEPSEIASWRRAADSVVIPYDEALGLHGQDDTFLARPRWDLGATPADCFPLQDHFHLLDLYRHQVLKQADLVLAMFIHQDRFTPAQRRANFDHYESLTSHDSSLSAPIHAIVATDVDRLDDAWGYTERTAFTDLDGRGALSDGVHLAAAAGGWLAVACGWGGLRVHDGAPTFHPRLPAAVSRIRFRVRWRRSVVEVDRDTTATTYRLVTGGSVSLRHVDTSIELTPAAPVTVVEAAAPRAAPPGPVRDGSEARSTSVANDVTGQAGPSRRPTTA